MAFCHYRVTNDELKFSFIFRMYEMAQYFSMPLHIVNMIPFSRDFWKFSLDNDVKSLLFLCREALPVLSQCDSISEN